MSSGTFEVRTLPTIRIRWTVKGPTQTIHYISSPTFQFGNTTYCLKCRMHVEEVCVWYSRQTKTSNPSVPASVTVHVEGRSTAQIVPSLSGTKQNPKANRIFWRKKYADIQKELPNFFSFPELTFVVAFQANESVTDEKSVQTSLCIDPIPCSESLSEDLENLLQLDSDSNPDIEFQCDGHGIKAHRLIVSSRSPVLAKMLQSQMVEGETGVVKIVDMELGTLKLFVRYLYRGRLDEAPTFELAMDLYEAADKYEVKSLARRCAQSLIEYLTVENACDVLDLADRHSDEKLVEEVVVFALEKKVPSTSEHWRPFCRSHPLLATEVLNRYVEELTGSAPPRKKHCANNSSTKQPL